MLIYILLLFTILWIMLLENIINQSLYINYKSLTNKKNKKLVIFVFIFLLLLTSFRYNIGWDYSAYYNTIVDNLETNIISRGEFATIYLIKLAQFSGLTNIYFFANGFICLFLIYRTILRYSNDYWISLLFFICFPLFFLNSLSVIRFFTALAITFYGFKYIEKQKFLKFLVVVFIASLFHKSALIVIIYYFIYKINLKTRYFIIFLVSIPLIKNISILLIEMFFPEYVVYLEATSKQEGTKAIIVFVFIGIVAILLKKFITISDRKASGIYNMYMIGLINYLMFFSYGTLGHRLSLYGTIYSLLLIPKLISIFTKKDQLFIKIVFYLLCIIMFFYTLKIGAATYLPYKSIFNKN